MYLCWCSSSLHRYLSSLWALSWAFYNVIWAAAFTYYIYLDASWCSICVCLSSFWAWFWGFPNGIWAIPCSKLPTQTYVYLCWCSSSLHRYLSSLWALSRAFPNVIFAATFTKYIYLGVLYVFVWAHFELDFEVSPMEFELSHAQKNIHKHICTFVGVLHHYIGIWAHFELCLGLFPMWFELLPLHTTYTLMHLDVLYVFVWAHFELDFEVCPLEFELSHAEKNIHKHTCSLVEVLHHYIDIRAHFELCLEPSPKWFELLPLHTTYTLLSYTCSFELILSFPHWNLSYPMHKKSYVNICVPLLVFFITTSVFELTLSSVLGFFQCDLSCCLYILHIPWCTLMSYICLFDSSFWAWFWVFPTGIWAISCTKKHTSTYV